jgi:hypothetical protein
MQLGSLAQWYKSMTMKKKKTKTGVWKCVFTGLFTVQVGDTGDHSSVRHQLQQ